MHAWLREPRGEHSDGDFACWLLERRLRPAPGGLGQNLPGLVFGLVPSTAAAIVRASVLTRRRIPQEMDFLRFLHGLIRVHRPGFQYQGFDALHSLHDSELFDFLADLEDSCPACPPCL